MSLLTQLRQQNPVVLTVANMVTPADVANGLNVLGASPIMSKAVEEAEDMVKLAQAVTINLGTVDAGQRKEMLAVLDAAEKYHVPAVFDPVACAASRYRQETAAELLNTYRFACIRGNAGEIAALAGCDWQSRGIDAGSGTGDLTAIAKKCAAKYQTVVAMTGESDIITDGQELVEIPFGSPLFAVHVGTGDMFSSIIAAFVALGGSPLDAAASACEVFALCGQIAAKEAQTPSRWYELFLDKLYQASDDLLASWKKELQKEEER
ncbi:hydroxyethylthiazole kinase [Lactobacillus nasalidis]|uniref:Hydroxyethylthiazole kinase n=1 Tax=Lactobacillus nasalidis TaxID=2797258 RepID=A0ABQ3WBT1_9LACO|nr:hydroxyethylthiazole kinase [Lactobacillus nasalidis]GHV97201.1 hydroxyethylthiazole kinase [Lactobacillus nasalidis]GHV99665.1 hydroxyethylthiazole kinase [Lactobacillus nasalidis]GHW01672.1 hydroxyethylthiazole kinase [Lactobacillus nasalidis]